MAGIEGIRVMGGVKEIGAAGGRVEEWPEFQTYDEVGHYLERRLASGFTVVKPFLPVVLGGLVKVDGTQSIRLAGDDRVGIVPRYISDTQAGVGASTASSLDIDLISHVEPWESKLLDRGLAWVAVGAEAPPRLIFGINPEHELNAATLAERLTVAEERVVAMINGVLDSDPNAPFSQTFPLPVS